MRVLCERWRGRELLEQIGRRDEVEATVPSVSNLKGIGDDELGAVASPPPGHSQSDGDRVLDHALTREISQA